jgi:hypothetical protein
MAIMFDKKTRYIVSFIHDNQPQSRTLEHDSDSLANTALTLNGFGYRWYRCHGSEPQQNHRTDQRQHRG